MKRLVALPEVGTMREGAAMTSLSTASDSSSTAPSNVTLGGNHTVYSVPSLES